MIGDNGRPQYLRFCLFEMYVNVVFVIRCLYSAVSLTLVREQRFIRIYYYYYYVCFIVGGVCFLLLLGLEVGFNLPFVASVVSSIVIY